MRVFFLTILIAAQVAFSVEFPEERTSEKDLFPRPKDGEISEVNPPAFAWLPVKDAAKYVIKVYDLDQRLRYSHQVEHETIFAGRELYAAGEYRWIIEAYDESNNLLATRRPYKLTIPETAIEFPFPDVGRLLSEIPATHPRIIFTKSNLEEIRNSLTTTRKTGWAAVKKMADNSLNFEPIKKPWYANLSKEDEYNKRRLEYRRYYHYLRPRIDEGLQALSIAWLMTGDPKYAEAGKKILLQVAQWNPSGITSSNEIGFDEPGLSFARVMHRAYDWLYDALSAEEREIVRRNIIERTRDTYLRIGINRPFHQNPGSSHDGRLIGYLCEEAIVLAGEAQQDEVEKWLEYSLQAFWTIFPHWGGRDGGWAEGIGYAAAYNIRATTWIESCLSALGLNLWKKPFFTKVKDYFLYCSRPNDEFWAFGDGAERGPRQQASRGLILRSLMTHYGQRFRDPAVQWWAEQVPLGELDVSNPVTPMILGVDLKGQIPDDLKNMAIFRDIGWAAMHSNLADLDEDVFFLFKSSPYGSVSHSHGDQNAFYLSVGGRALAIPSGYYGPVYGMPHHAQWTRSTKANNCILVNGKGQRLRDFRSRGKISDYETGKNISYVCGDAAEAYDHLSTFNRHVLYVRPGLFLIVDDLVADIPSRFQWMLHAMEKMDIDSSTDQFQIEHLGAQMSGRLFERGGAGFSLSQTDQFDTPYNEGIEPQYHVKVKNHWHLTAETKNTSAETRIAAVFVAGMKGKFGPIEYFSRAGWVGASTGSPDSKEFVFARLSGKSPLPEEFKAFFPRAIIKDDSQLIGVVVSEKDIVELWQK